MKIIAKQTLKKIAGKAAVAVAGTLLLFFVLDAFIPVYTDVPYATVVEARDGTVLHAWLASDEQWRMKATLEEISPELKRAIVYKEDKYFYHHFGINPFAVGRAMINNIFHLKRTSGASTITMQVARMLESRPRTYRNKCIEMFRALQLEVHYSKDEILQLYLNLVPYGSNIQGVKAAALLYFNKTPNHLSLAEITALSIIPNRPNSLVMGRDNRRIIAQRNKWLYRFRQDKLFPADIISDALREPLTALRHSAPNSVPQFAWRMRKSHPGMMEIRSTINLSMQQGAEAIVTNYVNELKLHNINNASVLIVNNKTHEVVTYIGSSEFEDRFHYGQVDGVCALRSPGSALKPLLYGLCFDRGLITPKTIVADIPINIQGYTPENYDRTYRGNVTVDYALSHSLNIPAVQLLDKHGVGGFLSTLSGIGFNSIWQKRKSMGLSVILGGCGVRLDELTSLYSAFANNGRYYPLQFIARQGGTKTKNDTSASGKGIQVITPSSCYMLTRVLSELHRPDLPNGYDQASSIPRIAWKTGTSYGRKDAWSLGYNEKYTIGVWLGNFSGVGVPDLSGATTATPLLFQLFNAIDYNAGKEWLDAPSELSFRLVCAETGRVPNDFCHNQVMDYYIAGVSSNDKCDHFREMWLSADERVSYCTSCLPPSGYKTKLLQNTPADLAAWYDAAHISYAKLPQHNPLCTRTFHDQPPIITSLTNGKTYLVIEKQQQKMQLACTAAGDVHKVYWYINDKFYAAADADKKLFFSPVIDNGSPVLKISCTDDKGRNANIQIKVRFI
jgi:penicillin-binding protein 1C